VSIPSWSKKPIDLLDQADLEKLHNCRKHLSSGFHWRRCNAEGTRWIGATRVEIDEELDIPVEVHLELEITWTIGEKFGFRLFVVETNQAVRMYHNSPGHSEARGKKLDGPHKHTNIDRLMDAYEVPPSIVDPEDFNRSIRGFFAEESIEGGEAFPLLTTRVTTQPPLDLYL
jgi:hypothetical protein